MAARTTFLLCVAALLILAAHSADGGRRPIHDDLVVQACRNASPVYLKPEYCETMLRSDKRSAAAREVRDLALIAIDLVERGAADVDAKVAKQSYHGYNDTAAVLQTCHIYSDLVARIAPLCRGEIHELSKHGDLGLASHTVNCVRKLAYAAEQCWDYMWRFHDDNAVNKAVGKEAQEVFCRSYIAVGMVKLMIPVADVVDPPI